MTWPTEPGEIANDPRTWVIGIIVLSILITAISLGYQYGKAIVHRRRRHDEETTGRRHEERNSDRRQVEGEEIELSTLPPSNAFRRFRRRQEREAAEQLAQRQLEQQQHSQASGTLQTPGVVVSERELHSSESSYENFQDEARWLSLRDHDYPLRQQRFELYFREHTVTRTPPDGRETGAWRHLVDHLPFPPTRGSSRSRVSTPPPSYG